MHWMTRSPSRQPSDGRHVHEDIEFRLHERLPDDRLEVLHALLGTELEEALLTGVRGAGRCVVDDDIDQLVGVGLVAGDGVHRRHLVAGRRWRRCRTTEAVADLELGHVRRSPHVGLRQRCDGGDADGSQAGDDEQAAKPAPGWRRLSEWPRPAANESSRFVSRGRHPPREATARHHRARRRRCRRARTERSAARAPTRRAACRAPAGEATQSPGVVLRHRSSTICFGRTRLRNGTNQAQTPQPGANRRSPTPRANRLRYARPVHTASATCDASKQSVTTDPTPTAISPAPCPTHSTSRRSGER